MREAERQSRAALCACSVIYAGRGRCKDSSEMQRVHRYFSHCLARLAASFVLAIGIAAGAGCDEFGRTSWQEEVLLHDGSRIVVERSVRRGGRHELGQSPPFEHQSLSFALPRTGRTITWNDLRSEDIQSANFLPMVLDIVRDTPYLLVHPMGCLSYNKWGRPNPPYVVFKYDGHNWQRISLENLPTEIKKPNLIFSEPDREVKRLGTTSISAEKIQQIISAYRQTEYRDIVREPLPAAQSSCPELVHDGKGGWSGLDWFTSQPSLEACLKVCEKQRFDTKLCPCDRVFGRK